MSQNLGAFGERRKPSMEERRLERDFRLYHWAGSAENWVQEQNGGDVACLSSGNGTVTDPRFPL